MLGSIASGVSGMSASQSMLEVVGNNLANLNTTGFKEQTVQFSDLLYQNHGGGGTNPIQVGSGVQVASNSTNEQQGSLTQTGGQFDLGLEGNGFFVVDSPSGPLYTRAGAFSIDKDGFLSDSATGDRVERTGSVGEASATSPAFQTPGSKDIRIPFGTTIPGLATANIALTGNLSATATGPAAQVLTSNAPFMSGGVAATAATTLNSLSDNGSAYVAGDSIRLQGQTSAGAAVGVTVPVGPATTLGDLVTAINSNFTGSTASISNGNLVVTAGATGPSKLELTIGDSAGDAGKSAWGNHIASISTAGKDGDTVNSAIQVFDIQGTSHNVTMTFQKQADSSWTLNATMPAADGTVASGQVTGITFSADGSFSAVGGGSALAFQFAGLPATQTVALNFGTAGSYTGLTQFGGIGSAPAATQDGFAAGSLTATSIGRDGTINGLFSNGKTLALAQVAVASFANPEGLDRVGSNYLRPNAASGDPSIGAGGSGARGVVRQGTLESSNVDISTEFTRLIIAQRGFEANAKTVSISDQILQDLTNIIR
jgi:flagellar hook protein FlgE